MDKRLIDTIEKIKTLSSQNAEFDAAMRELFEKTDSASSVFNGFSDNRLNEIYEYCIEKVIRDQAEQFYKNFPIRELVPKLVEDFCRMERYKREDNFEDFCLATFQQVENITNWFCQRPKFVEMYEKKKQSDSCIKDKDIPIPIINLVLRNKVAERGGKPLEEYYFNEKIRAVLYFVYFNEQTYKYPFDTKYNELNELYQCRNLNHRGGELTPYQEEIITVILPKKYHYFLRFTGLLSDYVGHICETISTKESFGTITNKLECGFVYIKPDLGDSIVIDKGRLLSKVKSYLKGERVKIERNIVTGEIVDINKIENNN